MCETIWDVAKIQTVDKRHETEKLYVCKPAQLKLSYHCNLFSETNLLLQTTNPEFVSVSCQV